MLRVLAVVATFVVLNAGGFIAYRATRPARAALIPPAASEPTLARPVTPIHPILPTTPPPIHSAPPTVTETTPPVEEKPVERSKPRVRVVRPTRARAAKPVVKEAPSPASEKLLEMEANPYKRGE